MLVQVLLVIEIQVTLKNNMKIWRKLVGLIKWSHRNHTVLMIITLIFQRMKKVTSFNKMILCCGYFTYIRATDSKNSQSQIISHHVGINPLHLSQEEAMRWPLKSPRSYTIYIAFYYKSILLDCDSDRECTCVCTHVCTIVCAVRWSPLRLAAVDEIG